MASILIFPFKQMKKVDPPILYYLFQSFSQHRLFNFDVKKSQHSSYSTPTAEEIVTKQICPLGGAIRSECKHGIIKHDCTLLQK